MRTALNERRLRLLVALFFVALALPAALLVRQAWDEAQWEAFQQLRLQAEAQVQAIDAALVRATSHEATRPIDDYVYRADPGGAPRSPLSRWPQADTLPGLLGYFQADSHGAVSSPLLPPDGAATSDGDAAARARRFAELMAVLAAPPRSSPPAQEEKRKADASDLAQAAKKEAASNVYERLAGSTAAQAPAARGYGSLADLKLDRRLEQKSVAQEQRDDHRERDTAAPAGMVAGGTNLLAKAREFVMADRPEEDGPTVAFESRARRSFDHPDLGEAVTAAPAAPAASVAPPAAMARARADKDAARSEVDFAYARARTAAATPLAHTRLFDSDIGPLALELIDDQHFVLFRQVWRDGERYVQGAILARDAFIAQALTASFLDSPLAASGSLRVAWRDSVLDHAGLADGGDDGALLLRARLSAPLAALELVYSATRLPVAPGMRYLWWVTAAFALIASGGCWLFYRLGRDQLRLQRQQQDFVAAVSHELKTPLTAIRMYAEILRAGWASEDKRTAYYAFIHDESERLSRLIGNVLELARMGRGNQHLEPRPQPLGEAFTTLRPRLDAQAERADFALALAIDETAAHSIVALDIDAFTQVLINLVDNAIKFTPAGSDRRVEIDATREGAMVRIRVRDFGSGIPAADLSRIFQLFFRAGAESTRETAGTGIGLALVEAHVRAMGGTVRAANRAPGAEFTIELPCAQAG